jgi:UDP-N-acetylenolpyruvoylglucosamine reductase
VFSGHANIICNRKNCRAEDILRLEKLLVEKVENRFGITLEREVVYID